MKIYNIDIKSEVHDFIWDVWEYIFKESFSFSVSKKVMDNIYKNIFSLKVFPYRYPEFNDKYRVFTINKKYRVFYHIDEENNTIIISRIFSSYQNYEVMDF